MFTYFESTNRQERESIATAIKNMYDACLRAENEAYARLREQDTRHNQTAYAEAIGKVGAIQGMFELLRIPF